MAYRSKSLLSGRIFDIHKSFTDTFELSAIDYSSVRMWILESLEFHVMVNTYKTYYVQNL